MFAQKTLLSLLIFFAFSLNGCERYELKRAARERRMHYLQTMADSARRANDQHGDSLAAKQEATSTSASRSAAPQAAPQNILQDTPQKK